MTFAALQPLVDRAALFAAIRQDQLQTAVDALGEHRWDADLSAGTLVFASLEDPARRLETRAHLIATVAPGPRSLVWAWAHPQGEPQGLSARLRAHGTAHGITELTSAEVPFAVADEDVARAVLRTAQQAAQVAVEVTGLAPGHLAPLDGGTVAVFLLEAPLPAPTLAGAMTVLPRLLATTELADPRTSIWGLARLAGWTLEWTGDGYSAATVRDGASTASFAFDEQGRITSLSSTLSAG